MISRARTGYRQGCSADPEAPRPHDHATVSKKSRNKRSPLAARATRVYLFAIHTFSAWKGRAMELRHLQYFLMVAREGTISGAANVLHISQPSLSRQMQDLEHELGCKLFERGSRRIELTEAGMRCAPSRRGDRRPGGPHGVGSFWCRPTRLPARCASAAARRRPWALIADAIAELQEAYPLLRFSLFSGNAEDVGERLDTGTHRFRRVHWANRSFSLRDHRAAPRATPGASSCAEDDPLAKLDVIRAEDFAGPAAHLLAPGQPGDAQMVQARLRRAGHRRHVQPAVQRRAARPGVAWVTW